MNVAVPPDIVALKAYNETLEGWIRHCQKVLQSTRGFRDANGIWQGGLYSFVKYHWDVLEPETELQTGWALEAMCEHLEAVTFGDIQRLLINVPPGFMKSLLTDVFWPAWEWGPMNKAHMRYVAFSYASTLTERDNDRFGTLLTSEKYQTLWGGKGDDDGVHVVMRGQKKVSNTRMGWKFASSIGGVGTGERGDRVILDDPHNVKESESEPVRKETVRWFRESMTSRHNNPKKPVVVVIMQRVHEEDVSGVILELGLDYCHLKIPMEYESAYQYSDDGTLRVNQMGWLDPRYDEGNQDAAEGALAWPERFPQDVIADLKHTLGPYAYAGQYQQAPSPRGGGIFERDWWQLYEGVDGKFPVFEYLIASLDSAFTEKEQNDPSGLTVWGIYVNDEGRRRGMLVHAWRKHLKFSGVRMPILNRESRDAYRIRTMKTWGLMEWVSDTCRRFKVDKLLIEAKASGISAAQELRNRYTNEDWAIELRDVVGDKVARALACQATFSQLLVYAPSRDWAEMVIDEMATFPNGRYKDLTDSSTQAIKFLRDNGMLKTDEEVVVEENRVVTHKPKPKAIYPV
jgi:predicted phage terminase large subunit-like protein